MFLLMLMLVFCVHDLSNEKRAPGCLGLGGYTTQFCGDDSKTLKGIKGPLFNNQYN